MKKQAFNPFLPSYEYIPDAEPRIFNDRVYIYGSHDKFNGVSFCLNDYVTYSAPLNDLSNWKYEGVIYKKTSDPHYKKHPFNFMNVFFAPDVIKGKDGYYYMYYTLGFNGIIGVARSDAPNKEFKYIGDVKYKDGSILGSKKEPLQFDPGIFIDDNGKIYLYSGYAPLKFSKFAIGNKKLTTEGAMVMELEDDMLTIKSPIKYICKTRANGKGTDFEGHEFFEASSMRKIYGKYYFIYSSYRNHELCYAISNYPDRDFKYGGTLVSLCDEGINATRVNNTGNTHGSILEINDEFYIFYHRQTNRNSFSRQACAQKITFNGHGFKQSEVTSCGLNNGPLSGKGTYPSYIACNLYSSKGTLFYSVFKNRKKYFAYFTQDGKDRDSGSNQYIKKFSKYTIVGFKYFKFDGTNITIEVVTKGLGRGNIVVATDNEFKNVVSRISITHSTKLSKSVSTFESLTGIYPLYFKFVGSGTFNFYEFTLS